MLGHDYDDLDACALAALVRRGEVSALELLAAARDRIEGRNRGLNAVVRTMFDEARSAIARGLPDGPLRGVPMLLKDLMADVAGIPTTSGSHLLARHVPDRDAEIVARWRRAGLVFVGKTNTPELGIIGVTEPVLHGASRNPWDRERTPGGSSGGSASAVAARMVPIAGAGDGGGSIRIPAACCGLVGLKPTRGRTPNGPGHTESWSGFTVQHVLTRSLRDSATMLDVASGNEAGALSQLPAPARPFVDELAREPGRLRIGVCAGTMLGGQLDPEHVAAVRRVADVCASLGHDVEEALPELDWAGLARAWLVIVAANVAAEVADAERRVGRPAGGDIEPLTALIAMIGRSLPASEFVAAHRRCQHAAWTMAQFHQRHDLWLSSTLGHPPARIGAFAQPAVQRALIAVVRGLRSRTLAERALDMMAHDPMLAAYPNTQLANMTGQPAISLPLATTATGLPLGVQLVAPFGDEAVLLRIAAQLETVLPWATRRPALASRVAHDPRPG
ncbi:MAG: amidase [Deltaproteobacteria bacterium]|nr:amidase [Deltaproteobacteria bacterium]